MYCHHHLTLEEREQIMKYLVLKKTVIEITTELHRSKSTISREIKRNSSGSEYRPSVAQANYVQRRKKCRMPKRLDNPELYRYVKERFLEDQWSLEQISGRIKLEESQYKISYSTIFRAIYAG